jgi:tetratricopeptide (TPR) repeat protein
MVFRICHVDASDGFSDFRTEEQIFEKHQIIWMMKKTIIHTGIVLFLLALGITTQAQNERKFVRQGNEIFEQALQDSTKLDTTAFSQAETAYRRALEKRPDDLKWNFNLGDALYKQMKFDQAISKFEEIAEKSEDKIEKSRAYHNLGNSMMMQDKLDESIEAYKKALRNNPEDLESKYNLVYAMNLKKQQEEQQQNQNQDQNKDQEQNQDQKQNQDQQDQNKDQDQDQKNQDQQKQDQNQDQQQQQQQPQEQKISKENAERLLQALQNDEEKIQEKVKKAQAAKAQQRQTDKDW